jgi:hypothetical protein
MNTEILTHDYHCSIAANVSASEAFDAICQVSAWWTTDFEGRAEKPGDVFTVTFGETFSTFTITEAIPGQKVVWRVLDCNLNWLKDKKEWKDTTIEWAISSQNNLTRIDMTHFGLVPEVECFSNCQMGWNHYIQASLFKLLTEKKGLPGLREKMPA